MGFLSRGYYAICLSCILSLSYLIALFYLFLETDLEQPIFLGLNISILVIQACGIVLCVLGYRKHETIESLVGYKGENTDPSHIFLIVALTIFLVMWASFIVSWVSYYVFYSKPYEKLWLMRNTLQFAAYVAWALKGTIGIISGLIFTIKFALRKTKTET